MDNFALEAHNWDVICDYLARIGVVSQVYLSKKWTIILTMLTWFYRWLCSEWSWFLYHNSCSVALHRRKRKLEWMPFRSVTCFCHYWTTSYGWHTHRKSVTRILVSLQWSEPLSVSSSLSSSRLWEAHETRSSHALFWFRSLRSFSAA